MSSVRVLIRAFLVVIVAGCAAPDVSPGPSPSASPTGSPVPGPLVTIETRGGLCPNGPCGSTLVIEADGRIRRLLPEPALVGSVPPAWTEALQIEIERANFLLIASRPFTGECPVNFDGQETIFTFHAPSGDERVASCEVAIDPNHPLFRAVSAAVAAVTR